MCLWIVPALWVLAGCGRREAAPASAEAVSSREPLAAPCIQCHTNAYNDWLLSDHALAQRMVSLAEDAVAFEPPRRLAVGAMTTDVRRVGDQLEVETLGPDGTRQVYYPDMVIGRRPLIQYLIPFPGGRWQTLSVSYDPASNEWFEVYGDQDRRPHEWGFWSNRGMNWNVQCAYCHMTNLDKGYDPVTDTYHTTWDEASISCQQCHGVMEGHAEAAAVPGYTNANPRARQQALMMCASCHSRREELTGAFQLGDHYADHYRLTLPDAPGIYYADGQILDEDYVYGSFMMSKMGNKDVACVDCHNIHSGAVIIPATNNMLCLQCHIPPGLRNAPPIFELAHSHHQPGSTGNQCVECHMANTTYMARDPRRDHGFIIPDPLLTKELGIPNSCNRCHADKTVDWSIEWMDKWYGERMNRPARTRARLVARAHAADAGVVPELLAFAAGEDIPAWRAAEVSLLAPWIGQPEVFAFTVASLTNADPLVRSAALRSIRPLPQARALAAPLLNDPIRLVRLDAAMAMAGQLDKASAVYREFTHYLDITSDQPAGALRRAEYALMENRLGDAEHWVDRAISWEPNAGYLHYFRGMVLNRAGRNPEAVGAFQTAIAREPDNADYYFSLALLYGELGQPRDVVRTLTEAVNRDPRFTRAWYNLGLAHAQLDNLPLAVTALQRAEALDPANPDFPYARATVHLRQDNPTAARAAAAQALARDPAHAPSRRLLEQLAAGRP